MKKAALTLDTSDPFTTDPGSTSPAALPPPINPFASQASAQPAGLDAQRLLMPIVSKPSDFTPAPSLNLHLPEQASNAQQQRQLKYMEPVSLGLSAGATVGKTTNSESAVLNTLGAGAAGVAEGGATGGLYGAVAGGIVGLVSGGIQSYTGLKQARADKRASDKQTAYIKKWNEDERAYNQQQDALRRSDSLEQQRYNRRQNAIATQWKAFQSTFDILHAGITQDENLRSMFVKEAR